MGICCCLVAKSCPILCDPMDCRMLGFPVLHCSKKSFTTSRILLSFEQNPGGSEGQGSLAWGSPCGCKESDIVCEYLKKCNCFRFPMLHVRQSVELAVFLCVHRVLWALKSKLWGAQGVLRVSPGSRTLSLSVHRG